MKLIAIGLVVIIAAHVGALECLKYSCAEKLDKPTMCASINSSLALLSPCSGDNTYCPISFNVEDEVFCLPKHKSAVLYPGEYCIAAEECFSNNCTGHLCAGKLEADTCGSDIGCNAGLGCVNTVCTKLGGVGDECNDNKRCDASTVCHNGNCTRFGSIENGNAATIPAVCKSFFLKSGNCVAGYKRVGDETCTNDACNYTNQADFYLDSCACGRTENINGFCPPGKGDADYTDVCLYC